MSERADAPELLLGRAHGDGRDWARALGAPHGNETIRTLAFLLPKALRRCAEAVTFDRATFERATTAIPRDVPVVLAPSHRSYFDFMLMSYLCFAHPELGLRVPHIAAAEEFGRIPVVGRILRRAHAFYLRRGVGGPRPELDEELRRVLNPGGSLMFFIEGQRSRSRHTLTPKRGLLRALQATGRTFAILPVAISYERLPEERSLERELTGGHRSRMYVGALTRWLARLSKGQERMGRIHLACGTPLSLDRATDVAKLARRVVAGQQRATVLTRMHLRTFIDEAPWLGVTEDWLAGAIERRGGRVLDAGLPAPREPSIVLRQSLRNQWMPWFFGDACSLMPASDVVHDHVHRRGFFQTAAIDVTDTRLRRLVEELFAPVLADYALAKRSLGSPGDRLAFAGPLPLVRAYPSAHLPHLEDAFQSMVDRGVLVTSASGAHAWGPAADTIGELFEVADAGRRGRPARGVQSMAVEMASPS